MYATRAPARGAAPTRARVIGRSFSGALDVAKREQAVRRLLKPLTAASFQRVADLCEHSAHLSSDELNSRHDKNRNEAGDQRIFNRRRAILVLQELGQDRHSVESFRLHATSGASGLVRLPCAARVDFSVTRRFIIRLSERGSSQICFRIPNQINYVAVKAAPWFSILCEDGLDYSTSRQAFAIHSPQMTKGAKPAAAARAGWPWSSRGPPARPVRLALDRWRRRRLPYPSNRLFFAKPFDGARPAARLPIRSLSPGS